MNDTMKAAFADELAKIMNKEAQSPLGKAVQWAIGPGKKPILLVGGGALAYHEGKKALEAQRIGRAVLEQQQQR